MISDYWIYQARNVPVPWSLYVVKEHENGKRKVSDVQLDVTVYHESIANEMHSASSVGIRGTTVAELLRNIEGMIVAAIPDAEFTQEDREQLHDSIVDLLVD